MTRVYLLDIRELTDDAFSRWLPLLSPQRREKIERVRQPRDKLRSLGAGILSYTALGEVNVSECTLLYNEDGKPVVDGREDLFFSLSHSGDFVSAALSSFPVAVDVQEYSGGTETIVRRFFSDAEKAEWEAAATEADRRAAFYRIFSKKECRIKLEGLRDIRHIDTARPLEGFSFTLYPLEGYSFVLYGKTGDAPEGLTRVQPSVDRQVPDP